MFLFQCDFKWQKFGANFCQKGYEFVGQNWSMSRYMFVDALLPFSILPDWHPPQGLVLSSRGASVYEQCWLGWAGCADCQLPRVHGPCLRAMETPAHHLENAVISVVPWWWSVHHKHPETFLLHPNTTIYLNIISILKLMQPPLLEVSHLTAQLPFYVLLGCACVVTSPLWTWGLEGKTFQEALILAKEVMKFMDLSLPLTPPSPPPSPVGRTSAQAGGAHPRTPLCSGPGSPSLLPTPSSCSSISREPWSLGNVF